MSYPTLNGEPVDRVRISMPRVGAWHAEVRTTSDTEIVSDASSATLVIDGVTFVGTLVRGGVWGSRWTGKIVGGAGGLSLSLPAKFYSSGPSIKTIVADILREAGETLSSSADSTITATILPKWQRIAGPASRALTAICDSAGASWRVLGDGTIWIGVDTFPTATVTHTLLDEDWIAGITDIKPDAPDLTPGVTFEGHRLSYVVHLIEGGKIRTEAHQIQPNDSLTSALNGIRQEASYARMWPADVVSQHSDGTLELKPLDSEISGFGLDNVPIRYGIPGTKATVSSGTRVRVGFDGGDPSRPFAALWDSGSVTLLTLGDGTSDFVALANQVLTQLNAIQTWANSHTHPVPGVTTGPGATTSSVTSSPLSPPSSVAATKVKAV